MVPSKATQLTEFIRGVFPTQITPKTFDNSRMLSFNKSSKCYNCGRKGHFKRDCWFKKGIENTAKLSKPQECVASTLEDGEVLYSKGATVSTDRKVLTEVWLMDKQHVIRLLIKIGFIYMNPYLKAQCSWVTIML
jgi:hypothetical protein